MTTNKTNTLYIDSTDIKEISEVRYWHINDPAYTWDKASINKGWKETILCEDGSITDSNILLKLDLLGKRDMKALMNPNRRAYGERISEKDTQHLWTKGEVLDNIENSVEVTPTWILELTLKTKSCMPSKVIVFRNEELNYSVFVDLHKFLYIQKLFKSKRNTLTFHVNKYDISTQYKYHKSLASVKVNDTVECLLMPIRPFFTVYDVDYQKLLKEHQQSLMKKTTEEVIENTLDVVSSNEKLKTQLVKLTQEEYMQKAQQCINKKEYEKLGKILPKILNESSRRNLAMKCWDWVGIRKTRYLSR